MSDDEASRSKTPAASGASAPAEKAEDVVFVHRPLESGDGYHILRKRDDALHVGELRTMKEGRPIHGEVVKLKPREGQERLFDVETVTAAPGPALGRKGPAKVATQAYRANWEAIFGRAEPDPTLN